ncbi:MAG: hypothetical protein CMH54_12190 [Myxococcales bacterium]|nr:hypothetical protein [Myxococcales bacterium]
MTGAPSELIHDYTEISWNSPHEFKIVWADGHESLYSLDFLRLNCPCAGCQGHGEQIYKDLPEDVAANPKESAPPAEVWPVGDYAIGIRFSDGHETGIFSFRFLRRYCPASQGDAIE